MHPRHWRPCGPTCTSLFYIHYFKEENSAAGGGGGVCTALYEFLPLVPQPRQEGAGLSSQSPCFFPLFSVVTDEIVVFWVLCQLEIQQITLFQAVVD